MSGFAPNPAQIERDRAHAVEHRYRHTLERIAHGEADNPRVEAKVALGELPIGALLTPPDPETFCIKCNNKGRTTKGPHKQQFGCPGCGYLVGEHPAYTAMRGASS